MNEKFFNWTLENYLLAEQKYPSKKIGQEPKKLASVD